MQFKESGFFELRAINKHLSPVRMPHQDIAPLFLQWKKVKWDFFRKKAYFEQDLVLSI
jgi:hypothetical protein